MKSKKAKGGVGFVIVLVAFLLIITSFSLIPIFKESLDDIRDTNSLNCQGTTNFNATAFQEDTDNSTAISRLTRRPTCFVTGISMVWFQLSFLFAVVMWVGANFGKKRRALPR